MKTITNFDRFWGLLWVLALLVPENLPASSFQSTKFVISSPSHYATEAGVAVAKMGGNVVDAAVAMELVLSVSSPYNATLGGGGFALIKMAQEDVVALDFREKAPGRSTAEMFKDRSSQDGPLAVAVPGIPLGLWDMHQRHGKLKWKDLFRWAIELAEKGQIVSGEWAHITLENLSRMSPSGRRIFSPNDKSLKPGDTLRQTALAKGLRLLQKDVKEFYQGQIAQDIVKSVKARGGLIDLEDLKNFDTRWLKPIDLKVDAYDIKLMPPPSSGGVVIASMFKILERWRAKNKFDAILPLSAKEAHLLAEIERGAFRSRSLLGDPGFARMPLEQIFSDKFIDPIANAIDLKKKSQLQALPEDSLTESSQTTHFSVMDQQGNAVAMTITANGSYGSGEVTDKYGIVLNNQMDDFTTKPNQPNMFGLIQGRQNQVQPGKRPLSSMSPTIVLKNGKPVLSIGAPGGPRIISSVFQVLYRRLLRKDGLEAAVLAPRLHHQFLPDKIYFEKNRWSPEIFEQLKSNGFEFEETTGIGRVFAVGRAKLDPEADKQLDDEILESVQDPRGESSAGGY